MPEGLIASAAGLPGDPVEARERLAREGVTFEGQRASERRRYTVEKWRAAGRPSCTEVVAARRLVEVQAYVERRIATLPSRLEDLKLLAGTETHPADAVAVNRAIIERAPDDVPAHNRLGRAYQELGPSEHAQTAFEAVIRRDPANAIARKRFKELRYIERGPRGPG
ncbi:MAG: hypothetical protein ACLP01_28725 [Solirubrobacteraceae bacterium]